MIYTKLRKGMLKWYTTTKLNWPYWPVLLIYSFKISIFKVFYKLKIVHKFQWCQKYIFWTHNSIFYCFLWCGTYGTDRRLEDAVKMLRSSLCNDWFSSLFCCKVFKCWYCKRNEPFCCITDVAWTRSSSDQFYHCAENS